MHSESSPQQPRRYAMFISYRHADNLEMGRKWATWLHETVENYQIPADLIGRTNLRGEPVPATLYPVFRDEEELPADADLSSNIRLALENSNLLVVLCSPRAVQSRFVADEIRHFKEIGKSNRILALMIDGEPNASDDPEKLARLGAAAECFPEPLKFGVPDASGRVDWSARTEPIAADCRPGGRPEQGWTTAAAYGEWLEKQPGLTRIQRVEAEREYAARLELAKLKVIAGAIGLPLGELTRRDKARQLQKAKQRARILLGLSGVFALLAGAAAVLGWMANERRKEAETQRREADHQRQEANAQRQQAETQRQAADDARGQAETEKRQAVATLAASDFQEGINRLAKSGSARGGLAFLARSARAGHESAATRIWTLFQQRPFWLPLTDSSAAVPEPAALHRMPSQAPALFASVKLDGADVAPTWYAESADGKRCITVVSTAEAGEGPITFRVWETTGKPVCKWLKITYTGDNYLSGIDSAVLSEDGRFAAIIASPWRAPQFIEVWDVNKGVRVGEPIPATGGHPDYQGGAFTDVWFMPPEKDAIGPLLISQSNLGDASAHRIDADPETPAVLPVAVNSHDQPVTLAIADPVHHLLASTAVDHSIRISSLLNGESIGWPLAAAGNVEVLRVDAADRISIRLEGGKSAVWRLVLPAKAPTAPQTRLALTSTPGLHKQWPVDGEEVKPADTTPVIADTMGSRQLRIVNAADLQVVDTAKPDAPPAWSRRFSTTIARARFSGDSRVIVQTGFFATEVWDFTRDALVHPAIDETSLFDADTGSDTVLLSSLSPDGKLVLTRSFLWDPPNLGVYSFTTWDTATGKPVSDRTRHVDDAASDDIAVNHAEISADGNFLLFGNSSKDAKPDVVASLQLRPPAAVIPLIPDLAEALGGFRLKPDGNLEPLASDPAAVLEKVDAVIRSQ